MPLTWDVSNIRNHEEVTTWIATEDDPTMGVVKGSRQWHPVTMALIWHSIGTGLGDITEENADEVYARVALIERLHGPMLIGAGEPRYITPEEVHAHIGLSVNVFPPETRAKFLKRQAGSYLDEKKKVYRRTTVSKEAVV